jgi:hypothetical protein
MAGSAAVRWVCLALVALLAGCITQPVQEGPVQPIGGLAQREIKTGAAIELVNGTFPWNHCALSSAGTNCQAWWAAQVFVNPCIFNGKPDSANLELPTRSDDTPSQAGNLTITLRWDAQDFVGSNLVVAYMAPDAASWNETARISNGKTVVVPVHAVTDQGPSTWQMWVCLNPSRTWPPWPLDLQGWQPGPFVGSLKVNVAFMPA